MFDFVRTHSRLMLGVMVLLIFPSFVFFGIQGYSRFTDGSATTVAKVDGQGITRSEWDQAHQRSVERVRRQMPNVDVKLLDTPQMRRETLDGLLRERVLLVAANKLHLSTTDERVERLFKTDPQFAGMRNPDGTVNKDLLALQGMSSLMFEQQLRQEIGMQQVLSGVTSSAFAAPAVARTVLDALLQRREIQVQRFDAATYMAKVAPTDADIEAYYKSHESQFRAPERATIEYVLLDLDTVSKGVQVTESQLQDYYKQNLARYTVAEERRISHILIKADKDASASDRKAAKARAETLLAEVRKNPAGFAEMARKNSQDPGSAAQGGDLDFVTRGAMVKPFEDAAFAMKQGEISDLVETEYGYHILMLTAVRGGQTKSFEALRAEIETEVRKREAQTKYAAVAVEFTNIVYEQPDSLQPVIDKLKLEKRSATVQRTPAPGATGVLASAKLLDAIFGSEAIRNKRNTEALEVAPNQMASARIVDYVAAHTLPLAEVKDRVRASVAQDQAAALARKDGQSRLAALKESPTETLPNTLTVSRGQPQGVPRQVLDAVMRADASKLPVALGVDLADAGYVVLRLTQVLPREPAPGGDGPLAGQVAQTWAAAESQAYLGALKKRYKAEVKEAVVSAAVAASAAAP